MLIKSPLKWVGGKSFLAFKIIQDLENLKVNNFIEPFCGSIVLSLNVPDNVKPLANDINSPLINFYTELQTYKDNLIKANNYNLTEEEYYQIRTEFNQLKNSPSSIDLTKLASHFYYLNKAGFNGLYRENNKGEFNVPWGKRKSLASLPSDNQFYSSLSKIQFTSMDYQQLVISDNSTLLYLDPPYDTEFTKYSKNDFKWEDQINLLDWAIALNIPFIISNQATTRIIELYKSYNLNIEFILAPRRISCNGDRSQAHEVYAKNF